MELHALGGVPEIDPGTDIAAVIADRTSVADDDVFVVASTIVSKAEGRHASLDDFSAGPRAREIAAALETHTGDPQDPRFAQAVLEESTEVIMEAPFLLTETPFGHIGVNAGIDRSNTGRGGDLLLLPEQPSQSAARIRERLPADPGVVVTDTCGRPFRNGQTGVAIGWAGLSPCRDWRGEADRDGYRLDVTVQCVVDELAGAANLLMGEGDPGTPVVRVTGWEFGSHDEHHAVFREVETDFVRQALREWTFEAA